MNGNTATVGYRYITRQPGVRSGHAIIEGTRVGVHDVIGLLQNGETVESVVTRCFPNITRELLNRGYKEADVKKILGENFLRVLREVEKK